jgi:hypothetical protein
MKQAIQEKIVFSLLSAAAHHHHHQLRRCIHYHLLPRHRFHLLFFIYLRLGQQVGSFCCRFFISYGGGASVNSSSSPVTAWSAGGPSVVSSSAMALLQHLGHTETAQDSCPTGGSGTPEIVFDTVGRHTASLCTISRSLRFF